MPNTSFNPDARNEGARRLILRSAALMENC